MSTIHSLSMEVLQTVLVQVDSIQDLAQCRLVCKCWDHLAEKAMFGKKITLKSDTQAMVLYAHLFKNSSLGKLVKYIHFGQEYRGRSTSVIGALMRLAVTPGIEYITGIMNDDTFYTTLEDIIDHSSIPFDKLWAIPDNHEGLSRQHQRLAFKLKESLSRIVIHNGVAHLDGHLWDFLDQADEFKHLRVLELVSSFTQIPEVERALRGCQHLIDARLLLKLDGPLLGAQQLASWMETYVEKVETLESLTVFASNRADFFEYLMFKYPNLKTLSIKPDKHGSFKFTGMAILQANMDRVLAAIKHKQVKEFRMKVRHDSNFLVLCKYFSSKNYRVVVESVTKENKLLLSIERLK